MNEESNGGGGGKDWSLKERLFLTNVLYASEQGFLLNASANYVG